MIHVQRLILVACAASVLVGRAAPAAEAVSGAPRVAQAPLVRIEPGDQIRVEVFGNPELNAVTVVSEDGSVRLPLVEAVPVGGRSLVEAARRIETALKAGQILVDPHVTVSVTQQFLQHVTVLGEVSNPGRYPIHADSTVLDVIALAGGISTKGSDRVYLLRKDASGAIQQTEVQVNIRDLMAARSASSAALQVMRGGDSIVVPKGTFTIIGQVGQPGEYRIESGMLLFQAIARAGGVTPLGSASRVEIRRLGPDNKFTDIKGKKNMPIEPGDIVTVKERLF